MGRALVVAAALAAALPAAAQPDPAQPAPVDATIAPPPPKESPRWGSFDISVSGYRPSIDQELGGAAPFRTVFGTGRGWMVRSDVAKSLFTRYGALEVGLGAGYWEKFGKGLLSTTGARSTDNTAFKLIPLRAFVTYRFDVFALRYNVPLVPYGRVSLDRYQWWVLNGSGNTATTKGVTGLTGKPTDGSGATNGYSFTGGVAFLLDFIDRDLAREMDRDTGINNTYAFVDFTKSYVNDFGSSKSWNLSDEKITIAAGLLFVF